MPKKKVIIATRGSKLALWQAGHVRDEILKSNPSLDIVLMKIKTTGDKITDVPLAMVGGKGLFVKEIEEAMLRGEADLAVHSMKDVPTELPEGLHLGAMLVREDPRDALISNGGTASSLMDLKRGATVGTSSLRRSCQLKSLRADLNIRMLRGNLDTRLRKLDEGHFDAIVLAAAGVKRLGFAGRITEILDELLPAIGQGAIGIECRTDDDFINALIAHLNHAETAICVRAERALLKRLEGGCQVPIAAHARLIDGKLHLEALVGSVSGDEIIRGRHMEEIKSADPVGGTPVALGIRVAEDLLKRGADRILKEVYGATAPPINNELAS